MDDGNSARYAGGDDPGDAFVVLERRRRCLEDVLGDLESALTALAGARAASRWSGSAAAAFSWGVDELTDELRRAASALDEGVRLSRGAVTLAVFGGGR